MPESKMSPRSGKPMCEKVDIAKLREISSIESVDMDKDYNPIIGDLHKFVLAENVSGLQKFLFYPNGEEIWNFAEFSNFFDQRDGLGRTPLQLALMKGLPNMVAALLDAAKSLKNVDSKTRIMEKMCMKSFTNLQRDTTPIIVLALSVAAEKEEKAIDSALGCIRVLMEKAKTLKNEEFVKDILKAKASFKRGVLHYAGQLGESKLIEYLIAMHKEVMLFEAAIMEECTARKLPLHYAIDSNDKDSIKTFFSETVGTKTKDLREKLTLKIGRYCVRRSLFLFFDVCGGDQGIQMHQRQIMHKGAEVDFSKRILSPRKRSKPGMDEPQQFSSQEYTNKVIDVSGKCKHEKSTAILTDKSCFGHLEMPSADVAKQYSIIQTFQENPHRLEVVLCALKSLGDQVK
jgi:hypothetical protein